MPIELMPLPYAQDALAPAISAETIEYHYGKHHKAYVTKTNELIAGTDLEGKPLEAIVKAAQAKGDTKLFNQAAQVWNHGFYWESLSPTKTEPSADLAKAIEAAFGSVADLEKKLGEAAMAQFGSGWAWLLKRGDKLVIETTSDAEWPEDGANPLLIVDVWEHAYYIDRRNARQAYLDEVNGLISWQFASDNLARGTWWTYPA